jgi:hypothetical protein
MEYFLPRSVDFQEISAENGTSHSIYFRLSDSIHGIFLGENFFIKKFSPNPFQKISTYEKI